MSEIGEALVHLGSDFFSQGHSLKKIALTLSGESILNSTQVPTYIYMQKQDQFHLKGDGWILMIMALSQRTPAIFCTLSDIPNFEQVIYRVRFDIVMDNFS